MRQPNEAGVEQDDSGGDKNSYIWAGRARRLMLECAVYGIRNTTIWFEESIVLLKQAIDEMITGRQKWERRTYSGIFLPYFPSSREWSVLLDQCRTPELVGMLLYIPSCSLLYLTRPETSNTATHLDPNREMERSYPPRSRTVWTFAFNFWRIIKKRAARRKKIVASLALQPMRPFYRYHLDLGVCFKVFPRSTFF